MTFPIKVKKSPFSILFVDDEEQARKYFDKGLRDHFNILTAGSVEEAREVIRYNHRDIAVVVTDQRMPGGNGVKLLNFLRENHPNIIRLLTTAYSDLSEAIEAVNSGEILRYIQKPWDYKILKSEMKQAIELFELRLERNQMVYEKIMVKRKMSRIERVRSLILFAKFFSFLNYADVAINNFIKEFTQDINDLEIERDFESFDFGNQDVLETKFMLDIFERVQKEISFLNSYSFDLAFDKDLLKSLFESLDNYNNDSLQINFSDNLIGKVSSKGFSILINKLLYFASLSKSVSSISVTTAENGFAVILNVAQILLPKNSNPFVISPAKNLDQFYIDILVCYIIAYHHAATLEYGVLNDNLTMTIKFPYNYENYVLEDYKKDEIDNIILSVML